MREEQSPCLRLRCKQKHWKSDNGALCRCTSACIRCTHSHTRSTCTGNHAPVTGYLGSPSPSHNSSYPCCTITNNTMSTTSGQRERQASLAFQLLYLNLGGELLYVLRQRLAAQQVSTEKVRQVLEHIISYFVSSRHFWLQTFLSSDERVLRQDSLKQCLQSVVSASPIMKLTHGSYEKLYELIVAVFKWQLMMSPLPSSLMHVSMRHVSGMLDAAVTVGPGLRHVVQGMQLSLQNQLSGLNQYQWSVLRQVLLSQFFAGVHTRVSILVRQQKQVLETGHFVVLLPSPSLSFDGRISLFDDKGQVVQEDGVFRQPITDATSLASAFISHARQHEACQLTQLILMREFGGRRQDMSI